MKANRRLILLIIVVLTMAISVGCSKTKSYKGIESAKFTKDIEKVFDLAFKSMSEQIYYEEDIDKIVDNMNTKKYKENLNDYEMVILEMINEVLPKVKWDLTSGKKIVQSVTLDEVDSIIETINN